MKGGRTEGGREQKEKLAHAQVGEFRTQKIYICCSARTLKYSVTNRVDLYGGGNGRGHLGGKKRGLVSVVRELVWSPPGGLITLLHAEVSIKTSGFNLAK